MSTIATTAVTIDSPQSTPPQPSFLRNPLKVLAKKLLTRIDEWADIYQD